MQTAVNWMIEELIKKHVGKVGNEYVEIFEKAKEMEKQQMLDAFEEGSSDGFYGWGSSNKEQYYNETYGSKGSDEEKTNSQRFDEFMQLVTSSQTEISDEMIEKAARDYDDAVIYGPPLLHFEQGAFWYREQLKSRQ